MQIYPGSPWANGYYERFNGTLQKEVLNAEWFHTTKHAHIAINTWIRQYKQIRPHHALGMRPTVPEILLEKTKLVLLRNGARQLSSFRNVCFCLAF